MDHVIQTVFNPVNLVNPVQKIPPPMHPAQIPPWPICFGLETELGITVMEDPEADVVEESIALVRSAAQHGVANLWDYATEDPHRDARGFRVQELMQDTDEAG